MEKQEEIEETDRMFVIERRSVIVLGFIFLSVFTSYISIQNLQSSINEKGGLGVISLLCVYATSTVSCLFAPLAIRIFSAKWVIVISCSIHLLYAVSNFHPKFYTLVPTSILVGAISGPFWTTQGMYITTCSLKYAERTNKSPSYILGKFFSIFSFIFVWSAIIGNLLSSALLSMGSNHSQEEKHNTTYIANSSSSGVNESGTCCHRCAIYHCPYTVESNDSVSGLPDKTPLYYLLGVFVLCVITGLLISVFLLPPLPKNTEKRSSVVSSLASCGNLLKDPIMLLLIPSCMAFSWAQGFRWSDISGAYISCSYGVALVGYLMAAHGFCSGISAFTMAKLAKIVGRHRLLVILYIAFILLVVCYYLLPENRPLYVTVVVICVHGIIEGPLSAQIQATIGLLLGTSKEAAFANFQAWKSISWSIFFGISTLVCVKIRVIILISLYACALPCLIGAEIIYRRRNIVEVELEATEAFDISNNKEDRDI